MSKKKAKNLSNFNLTSYLLNMIFKGISQNVVTSFVAELFLLDKLEQKNIP